MKTIETLRAKAKGKFGKPKPPMPEGGAGFGRQLVDQPNVGDIAADMMSEDSRLTRMAKTSGAQAANRRGLLNSSMAEGAKMDAVARAVVPMAQQQASQLHQERMTDIGHRQNLEVQDNQARIATDLSELQADQQRERDERGFGFNSALSKQEAEQSLEASERAHGFNRDMAKLQIDAEVDAQGREIDAQKELAVLDANSRQTLMNMEADMRERLARIDVSSQDRLAMSGMVETMHKIYQGNLQTILSNPDMNAEDRNELLASSGAFLKKQTDLIEGIYNVRLDWGGGTIDAGKPKPQQPKPVRIEHRTRDRDDDHDPGQRHREAKARMKAREIASNTVSPNTIY